MEPVVRISSGAVRGRVEEGAAAFLGIPYAAPPSGPRRFGGPVQAEPWDGVRDTLSHGPTAPQPHRQFTLVPEPVMDGEDYLNLNVYTPDPGGGGLPVLVWIHGGGFTAGCNASAWYRGCRFARDGVVLVSINYRLGAEGFLAIEDAPLNRGLRDWIAGLEWVRDNVSRFGGDPDKVTIAGQSAGGVACAALLAAPPADGLFRSAICMSGSRMGWTAPEAARSLTDAMATQLGVPATRAGFAGVEPAAIVAAQDVVAAARPRGSGAIRLAFGPVADDELALSTPYEPVEAGTHAGVPLMLGATAEEFNATFANVEGGVDEARLERRLGRMGLDAGAIADYRAALADAEPWFVLGQAMTDSTFKAPAIQLADAWARGGGSAYLYSFDWRSGVPGMGAVHCLDIPFAFDNLDADGVLDVTGPTPPQHLADAVHRAWVDFVKDGDPGWDAYDTVRRPAMVFDETPKVVDDPWQLVRRVWR